MSSLQDLNTYSTSTITFTDNRPSGVVLSYPTARDVNRIITDKTITLQRQIEIIEIIKPTNANVKFIVDVNDVVGATVDFGTLPSGLSLVQIGDTYTINGITTVQHWDSIKAPTITIPDEFFGSFYVVAKITYTDGINGFTEIDWQDGTFIPQIKMDASTSVQLTPKRFRDVQIALNAEFTQIAVAREVYGSEFFIDVTPTRIAGPLPANTLTSRAGVIVDPYYFKTYDLWKSYNNPGATDGDATDAYGEDDSLAHNFKYVVIGAPEQNETFTGAGKGYVFDKLSRTLVTTLDNPNAYGTDEEDRLSLGGTSINNIRLTGSENEIETCELVFGTPFEDSPTTTSSGRVYLYTLNYNTETEVYSNSSSTTINPSSTTSNARFGNITRINDDYIAAGYSASYENKIDIFNTSGTFQRSITLPTGAASGARWCDAFSLCKDSNLLAGVAEHASGNTVHVINVSTGTQSYYISEPSGAITWGENQHSVAISEDMVAVVDHVAGKCHVYQGGTQQYEITGLPTNQFTQVDLNKTQDRLTLSNNTNNTSVYKLSSGTSIGPINPQSSTSGSTSAIIHGEDILIGGTYASDDNTVEIFTSRVAPTLTSRFRLTVYENVRLGPL